MTVERRAVEGKLKRMAGPSEQRRREISQAFMTDTGIFMYCWNCRAPHYGSLPQLKAMTECERCGKNPWKRD